MTNRVSFLIDGFNVYHSVKDAIRDTQNKHLKWLDYHSLCKSFITDVVALQGATLEEIYYFTALAHHAGADVVQRQKVLIKALESRNVNIILGNFKKKQPKCMFCHRQYFSHEEKETDVNIALRLIECFLSDECDTVILVTGDTDLVAAVTTAKRLFPSKRVGIAFPYKRANSHFKMVADFTFKLSSSGYGRHQFPNFVLLSDGSKLAKPLSW